MRRPAALALAILALWLVSAVSALAGPPSPPAVAGWPKEVPARAVLQGPSGGVVTVSRGRDLRYTVQAWRRDGRQIWSTTDSASCGNCGVPFGGEALQADGTYGPIGGDDGGPWKVDALGTVVRPGCRALVLSDSGCVAGGFVSAPGGFSGPGVQGLAPDGGLWEVGDTHYVWPGNGTNKPPRTVADDSGTIYTAFPDVVDRATGTAFPGLLIAVDPVTRTLLWSRVGPDEVLTGLGSGVLARRGSELVSVGPDGSDRWARLVAAAADTSFDAGRGRLYVSRVAGVVIALDPATGAEIWRTSPAHRARLLSVGRGGRVYVAIDAAERRAVRALRFTNGATAWERRTGMQVSAARELANGMVAVAAGSADSPASRHVLTLLDPR